MKKIICILTFILFMATTVRAQFIFSTSNKVAIDTEPEASGPLLMVGDNCYFGASGNSSIGTAGTPLGDSITNNIGVFGGLGININLYQGYNYGNYGVLGFVETNTLYNGRNYGLCGMVDSDNNSFGGAGIYATDCDYYYTYPHNIQGLYAAYFVGNVNTLGNLTAANLYTTMDRRLCDNIVPLSQSKRNGTTTLGSLLSMTIVEYNQKGRLEENIPEETDPEKAEKLRRELEFLKKEEQEMTSRRHFGVDARELQKVYPGLVLEGQDGYLSVNYLEMVPLVVRSIQELKQELNELKEFEE